MNKLQTEKLISELNEYEEDLPYRQSMFEMDFKQYNSKLKSTLECDLAEQYFRNIMKNYSKVK